MRETFQSFQMPLTHLLLVLSKMADSKKKKEFNAK